MEFFRGLLSVFAALGVLVMFILAGRLVYWAATRGECAVRTDAAISICLVWEDDLEARP